MVCCRDIKYQKCDFQEFNGKLVLVQMEARLTPHTYSVHCELLTEVWWCVPAPAGGWLS